MVLPIFASSGDVHTELGWRLVTTAEGAPPLATGDLPSWLRQLEAGDPRARLYVLPDGRLSLSVGRDLPPQVGPSPASRLPRLGAPEAALPVLARQLTRG